MRGYFLFTTALTLCYYHRRTRLNAIKSFCPYSLSFHLNVKTFSPLIGGCLEGFDAFRFFFKYTAKQRNSAFKSAKVLLCHDVRARIANKSRVQTKCLRVRSYIVLRSLECSKLAPNKTSSSVHHAGGAGTQEENTSTISTSLRVVRPTLLRKTAVCSCQEHVCCTVSHSTFSYNHYTKHRVPD